MPTTHPLGLYPALGVKEARERALAFLANPQPALLPKVAGGETFKDVAVNFIKRHVEATKDRPELRRRKRYILPQWAARPFRELMRTDVTALLDQIEDDNGARQADICPAIIRKIMRWYQARTDNYTCPIVPGMARTKPAERKRERILSDEELRALWAACDALGTFGALVRVLLLTAQREAKVARMRHSDIANGIWTIPAEAREKANAATLPLPSAVLEIVQAQGRLVGNPFVFAVSGGRGHFNSFSQRKEELDKALPARMPPWVLHDLRRTARSLMSRAGVRPDIAERVLGHAIAGVEGVYDRHHYDEEKGAALNALATLLGTILNPPAASKKVVPLPTRR